MALVITVAMVLGMMSMTAFAAEPTAPTTGSITVNSPVVGATYKVYKIFDMTTNAAVDSFSYTSVRKMTSTAQLFSMPAILIMD